MPVPVLKIKQHSEGHRKRACDKLLNIGYEKLYDYEIVELMLFLIFKRKDVKPIAKELIKHFGTIDRILNASKSDLLKIDGIGESSFNAIKIINGVVLASLKSKILKKDHIECFDDVVNYCKLNMKNLISEELRVIFLNAINEVISDEVMQKGDVDSVDIYPRSIAKRCLEIGAKGIIIVHNHPSGDPTPSKNDVYTTRRISEALSIFNVNLQDHIIIGGDRFISFKTLDLLNY